MSRGLGDVYKRQGVGITAEGDMLAALGLRYGTEEATEFSEKVHKTVALGAYRSSVEMAKERGTFEIYNSEREQNNPFIQRLAAADPKLYEDMKKYGRRNIACLTIAPTGTTSLMTQTTSGIEPVFLPVYKRRRKVNPNDTNVHVDFVDETGDAFEEYIVFHHKFVTWMEANGYDPARRYTQEEIDELVQNMDVPTGIAVEVVHEENEMDDFIFLILAAFILIYMILAAVFESTTAPIVLMFTIPLAAIGSLLALLFTSNSLMNANVFVGFIILIGIVVNNSIILIDYTLSLIHI